ncbi:sensor histidine kinase [Saccharopolyspora shandongensis]|uniref:sensor histidine kinase n=1 Tax=Saccharopolyspora shandongensis TaxID=418495 RepID=UPI0033D98A1C
MSAIRAGWRVWIPEGAAALVVLIAGAVEALISAHYNIFPNRGTIVPIVAGTAVAVGLGRRWPGVALALAWLIGGYQVVMSAPVLLVQLALAAAVVYGTSRWGSTATMVAGIGSVPAVAVPVALSVGRYGGVFVAALFGVSWMAGLALRRLTDRAAQSVASQRAAEEDAAQAHRDSEQAKEIARLREEQAQLARDVHDVVGHSLAVILAQAESAQFVDDADTAALRLSMTNIANLARSSLQDVRLVLTSTTPSDSAPGELRNMVETVRASGREITFDETGTARPLPPDLATVAYRVLQEMLTNAMRHGNRDAPIAVELRWADELRIETVNTITGENVTETSHGGHGLAGMRRRLESVGGRLDIRRQTFENVHDGAAAITFTATAWLPVRTLSP